jgi:hypothetical protein
MIPPAGCPTPREADATAVVAVDPPIAARTSSVAPQSEAITIPERSLSDWSITAVIFLSACAYLSLFYNYSNLFADEGIVLQGAQRILDGQLPHRDFFSMVTPGSYYWIALLFRVFGSSILVARGALVVYGGIFAALTYLVARRACRRSIAALTAYLVTLVCLPAWFMALHNWDSTVTAYLSLYCAVRSIESRSRVWPVATGSLAAITCLFEQSKGAGLIVGIGLGFLLAAMARRQVRFFCGRVGLLTVGLVWPFAATLVYFVSKHALGEVLDQWFWPLRHYAVVNATFYGDIGLGQYSLLENLLTTGWFSMLLGLLILSEDVVVAALPLFAVGFLLLWIARLWQKETGPKAEYYLMVSACLAGLLLATLATRRADLVHILFQAPLFLVVLAWLLDGRDFPSHLLASVRPLVVTGVVTSFTVFGMCLLWVPLEAHYVLQTRHGSLRTSGPDPVLDELQAQVRPGGSVFVYPDQALYYYLSGAHNPTRYDWLFPGMYTPAQFEEAFQEVDAAHTPLILFETTFMSRVPLAVSGTPLSVLAAKDLGAEYFLPRYRPCKALTSALQAASYVFLVAKNVPCPAE